MLALSGRERRSSILLALDRSLRSIDSDGHMRVEESRITKANISPYKGREIPRWQELGLDPEKTYRLFRDPKELEKAAPTFEGKPLLERHVPIDAELPRKELWVGTVGKVTWEDPYLVSRPLMVLTKEAIDLIESRQQRELSAAYRYDAEMQPGAWGGQQYDGRMVNIRGNHVAIVSEGRVGPDVHVADALPPELRRMSRNLTLAATIAAILAPVLPKDLDKRPIALALDGALGETPAESVITLDAEEMTKACDEALAEKKSEHGEDAELDDKDREKAYERARDRKAKDKKAKDKKAGDAKRAKDKKAHDEREEALDEREAALDAREEAQDEGKEDEEAKDRKRARDARRGARDKRAHDAAADPTDHRRDFRSNAEDSVTKDELSDAVRGAVEAERARAKEAGIAREKVRPLVGAVSMALDNAPDIYRLALKVAKVKTDGVHESALGALVDMAVENHKRAVAPAAPTVAMDAQGRDLTDVDAIFRPKAA